MRALEFITGHVIYNPVYTYKFQLKTAYIKQVYQQRETLLLKQNKIEKRSRIINTASFV